MNYIELFAGCGGLSLGLKAANFELVMANELSPMAAETYALNFFNEDLKQMAESPFSKPKKTLWLNSQFDATDLKLRLRENPQNFVNLNEAKPDISPDGSNLNGSLVVGSIVDFNNWLQGHPSVINHLQNGFGRGGIDLLSGGPPCQSFSMAGLRKQDCEKNSLPWEFAKFTQFIQPRIVLLENVTGILRPFKDEQGNKYYAWFEVAKAFATVGYIPLCIHINAKFAGVPQNRPRFVLIGLRSDFYKAINHTFNESEISLFSQPIKFFNSIQAGNQVEVHELYCREIMKEADFKLISTSFLRSIATNNTDFVTVEEAIDDLRTYNNNSPYPLNLLTTFAHVLPKRTMRNHEKRKNSGLVQRRFHLYQILNYLDNDTKKEVINVLQGQSHEISNEAWDSLSKHYYLVDTEHLVRFDNKTELISLIQELKTKKQTQRALVANQPAPAALSVPDDVCHYHHDELRTLTVREMARIQSFPDNFEFRSKVTTGGKMRSFEVPQYTQVGNAVPPILGRALGVALANLLGRR